MSQVTMPVDQRFHVTLLDESGVTLTFNNLTKEEYNDWENQHMNDDLDYVLNVGEQR